MKKGIYFAIVFFVVSCTSAETTDTEPKSDEVELGQAETEEPIRSKRDSSAMEPKTESPVKKASFNGNWFHVDYPGEFTASPTTPVSKFDNYTFVETDEARFTSPDGTVEFFVYSPQWGGDPIDYLIEKPNEKTVNSSQQESGSDDPFAVSHHWVTYEDKDGKYTRSYHSLMTESTHHVFGVKYTNQKMYERYKATYLAFKKSLQQFAD